MIETNDNTARVVPREEKSLRVFQMVPSNSDCPDCAWKGDCGEKKDAFEAAGGAEILCSYLFRKDKTEQIVKEI